jgi:glyceraldehyde-3-phosphate dehydrogenase/erythrose-4-phosphate dehydrogenase
MSAPTPATAATVESITAQLEAASRLDEVLATTQQRLESALAGIELSTVTAVELSVGNGDPAGVDNLKEAVQHTSDGLESLRRALGELAPSAIRQPPPDLGSARGG